jgi:hypothetical protein
MRNFAVPANKVLFINSVGCFLARLLEAGQATGAVIFEISGKPTSSQIVIIEVKS